MIQDIYSFDLLDINNVPNLKEIDDKHGWIVEGPVSFDVLIKDRPKVYTKSELRKYYEILLARKSI